MRALLAVVLLAVAAACGGQDRLSKEEYEVRVQELLVGPGSEATRLYDEIERGRLSCGQPFNDRAYGLASTERAVRALDGLGERGYRLGRE